MALDPDVRKALLFALDPFFGGGSDTQIEAARESNLHLSSEVTEDDLRELASDPSLGGVYNPDDLAWLVRYNDEREGIRRRSPLLIEDFLAFNPSVHAKEWSDYVLDSGHVVEHRRWIGLRLETSLLKNPAAPSAWWNPYALEERMLYLMQAILCPVAIQIEQLFELFPTEGPQNVVDWFAQSPLTEMRRIGHYLSTKPDSYEGPKDVKDGYLLLNDVPTYEDVVNHFWFAMTQGEFNGEPLAFVWGAFLAQQAYSVEMSEREYISPRNLEEMAAWYRLVLPEIERFLFARRILPSWEPTLAYLL